MNEEDSGRDQEDELQEGGRRWTRRMIEQHNTGRFCVVLLEEEKREGQGRKRKKEEKKGESGSEKSGRVEVLTQHALRK